MKCLVSDYSEVKMNLGTQKSCVVMYVYTKFTEKIHNMNDMVIHICLFAH